MSGAVPAAEEVVLPATLTIENTLEIASAWRDAGPEVPLLLDAAAVEQMCTPFVLTLVAALNERAGNGAAVEVRNPTAAFTDAFSDLGLFSEMMKMEFAA